MSALCPRCGGDLGCSVTSMFSTTVICCECKEAERHHPDYAHAAKVEAEHVLAKEYDFPGVGEPADIVEFTRRWRGLDLRARCKRCGGVAFRHVVAGTASGPWLHARVEDWMDRPHEVEV